MARNGKLDAPGAAATFGVRFYTVVLAVSLLLSVAFEIAAADDEQRLQAVKQLYEQKKWEEALHEARGPARQPAEFDFYAGMALAHLERWNDARNAFSTGFSKTPHDPRFLIERAGAEYKPSAICVGHCNLVLRTLTFANSWGRFTCWK